MSAQTWLEIRTWISLIGATGAGWANLYAVWCWRGSRWVQTFYGATGFMAFFYAWGYIFLIVTGNVFAWSNFYQNFGPLVWLLVWTVPAVSSARQHRKDMAMLKKVSNEVSNSLSSRREQGFDLP